MKSIKNEANNYFEYSKSLRRDFHKHPEVAFNEYRSSKIVEEELKKLGFRISTNIANTGIIGSLDGRNQKPNVMLRFDMDALPMEEENNVEYASVNKGVMHACGHDGHMAIGLTVARLLGDNLSKLNGSVKLCFQPAEEVLGGALGMIEGGELNDPEPDYALGLHIWNEKPKGWIALVPGPIMAGFDKFTIRIQGKGGHGAIPDQAKDPIVIAANIINMVQSVVSRNVSPVEAAVISITKINSGTAYNIIPEKLEMFGSIRTFKEDVREKILSRLGEIMFGVESAFECSAIMEIERMAPPVNNNDALVGRVKECVEKLYPHLNIDENYKTMVSEDMAFYTQEVPSCFILLGSANSEKGLIYGQHHPKFDFDEEVLTLGSAILAETALTLLK